MQSLWMIVTRLEIKIHMRKKRNVANGEIEKKLKRFELYSFSERHSASLIDTHCFSETDRKQTKPCD